MVNTKSVSPLRAVVMVIATLFAAAIAMTAVSLTGRVAVAEKQEVNIGRTYFRDELANSELAQKFYDVFDEMAKNGSFNDGEFEYDLTSVLTSAELSDYIDRGTPKLPVAFGAARDAFYMDHPELFYVDVYKLYVSAGTKNGANFASAGAGLADNYYPDNTFGSAAEVTAAIGKFDKAVADAVAYASDGSASVADKVRKANKYIAEHTDYDYGAFENAQSGSEYNGNVNTAYGALVEGKAMCGGYARAFKVVMDALDIPCVLIQGTACSSIAPSGMTAGMEAHMWNAVNIDGLWYGVDVTYNDGDGNLEKYTLVGDDILSQNHFADGVISSSGFELKYPVIRTFNYGVDSDKNGFSIKDSGSVGGYEFGYIDYTSSTTETTYLVLGAGYDGKNADELKAEGKYLAYHAMYGTTGEWSAWMGIAAICENSKYKSVDGFTPVEIDARLSHVQFGIIDYAPDMMDFLGEVTVYDPANISDARIMATSVIYGNAAYGKYVTAPYVVKAVPDEKGDIEKFDPLNVELTYSETLVTADGNEIGDDYVIDLAVMNKKGKLVEGTVSDIKWHAAENKLSFTFDPPKDYSHNKDMYNFTPVNLKGKDSGKVPDAGGYLSFARKYIICPKIFNDGRLYMQVYGEPQFVSASDESVNDFKDKNGQPIVGNQRSQLMLVVNEPSKAESDAMMDAVLDENSDTGIGEGDILNSSTYQINLHVCGVVQKVPTGSYMQVGFGFPEGYGPENAGVTFTVFHYTRKADGTIDTVEPVPCVVTEYGIIATVKSFSPFMICAVKNTSGANTVKSVYATVDGVGGSVENAEIRKVEQGGSVTFEIKKNAGYDYDRVLLNGVDVRSKMTGETLTLGYDELTGYKIGENANIGTNVLEVSFISERAKAYVDGNGIELVRHKIVVSKDDLFEAVAHPEFNPSAPRKNNVGLIVGIVVPVVILLIGGGLAAFFILRKKKATATATANGAAAQSARSTGNTSAANKANDRSANNTARPTSNAARPANTTHNASRPTNTTARPTNSNTRSTNTRGKSDKDKK